MNTMIEPDTRGIDALSGELDDNVAQVQALLFHELMAEMADQFPVAPLSGPDLEFDEQPWKQLPTLEDLEQLWHESPPLDAMLHRLIAGFTDKVDDVPRYVAAQRLLAEYELELRGGRDAAERHDPDRGGSGRNAGRRSAKAAGAGADVPGEPENGDQVGKSRQAGANSNTGRASKVSRRGRAAADS